MTDIPSWIEVGAPVAFVVAGNYAASVAFGTITKVGKRDIVAEVDGRVERFNVSRRTDYDGVAWLSRSSGGRWSTFHELGPADSPRAAHMAAKARQEAATYRVVATFESFRNTREVAEAKVLRAAVDEWLALHERQES